MSVSPKLNSARTLPLDDVSDSSPSSGYFSGTLTNCIELSPEEDISESGGTSPSVERGMYTSTGPVSVALLARYKSAEAGASGSPTSNPYNWSSRGAIVSDESQSIDF